jgi:DNA-binding CsgD family transcriptional regulator
MNRAHETDTDHQTAAAIARLTPKERECLERWMNHATAKEIALDLGVSHHAVEKRLKSARAKLGVATSLEAARLLADTGGYGRTASGSPELAMFAPAGDTGRTAALGNSAMRGRWIIIGVTGMILLAAALSLATGGTAEQAATATPGTPGTPKVVVIDRKTGMSKDAGTSLDGGFDRLDKNSSGYLEGSELAGSLLSFVRIAAAPGTAETVDNGLIKFDTDRDGRVSKAEFRSGLTELMVQRAMQSRAAR